ncbi:MAG TPA: flagellar assembly peptidoglycan hydrolase FlgJ [Steroidobacteraceae bacterium]|nr:flagellar assembly peptidoglycan hydrolase FlgJ [Steroidobacteraceae bacterium]
MPAPPIKDASIYVDLSGLATLKRGASASNPQALREVARQFESVFAKMMLKSMREASSSVGDSLFGSDQADFYQGMFDDQLSLELTKGKGLGLADLLVRQLQRIGGGAEHGSGSASAPGSTTSSPSAKTTTASAAATRALPLARDRGGITPSDSPAAGRSAPPLAAVSDGMVPSDSLAAATAFIQKLLSGNVAAANSGGSDLAATGAFRTPTSPEDFVQQLWPCAEEAGRELGIAPTHLIAQAALETGWGKSLPCDAHGNPSLNFFGIKAGADWTGGTAVAKTLEFQGGVPTPQVARFRAYESVQDSFRDYVALLRDNPRYAAALNTGDDAHAFASALQRGGYATDPAYAQKIASIAQNLASRSRPE